MVWIMRPAATSNPHERASSATTSTRLRPIRTPDDPRASSFIISAISVPDARRRRDGPATSVDSAARPTTNAITGGSSRAINHSGVSCDGRPRVEEVDAELRDDQPGGRPGDREQQGFDEQLKDGDGRGWRRGPSGSRFPCCGRPCAPAAGWPRWRRQSAARQTPPPASCRAWPAAGGPMNTSNQRHHWGRRRPYSILGRRARGGRDRRHSARRRRALTPFFSLATA